MDKHTVALFDFDGTLTRQDTLPLYIRHATGWGGVVLSMLAVLPRLIILACNGWKSLWGIDAGNTKEQLLYRCFAGRTIAEVALSGEQFASVIDRVTAPEVVAQMLRHIEQGDTVAIVTASVDVWVAPWARRNGVNHVIATKLRHDGVQYSGAFDGENCNGDEKVKRIASYYPQDKYHIVAYGNSSGDYPMFHYAHEAYLCTDGVIKQYK